MNPSPLRYPGGKHKMYNYIEELMRLNECTTYAEPFCGGAAVALNLLFNGIVKNIIINDYDYSIYCFWASILNETDAFIQRIRDVDVNLEEWYRQKEIRNTLTAHTSLDIGFSTFFLNRTNRSGIIDKAGPIGGLEQNGNYPLDCRFNKDRLISQIRRIADCKNHIAVYNLEALRFIDDVILNKRKVFTFFDPPYYNKGPGLYTSFYVHGDHLNLSKSIIHQLKRRKWIVTYDNVDAIKTMYAKLPSIEFQLQYTLQEKRTSSEVMFFSKKTIRPVNERTLLSILRE